MATAETVRIEGELCEVVADRQCTACEKSPMAVRFRTRQGIGETQHLQCPRCGATAHRQVDVVRGYAVLDSDFQHRR